LILAMWNVIVYGGIKFGIFSYIILYKLHDMGLCDFNNYLF